jgi:hypothetical protein
MARMLSRREALSLTGGVLLGGTRRSGMLAGQAFAAATMRLAGPRLQAAQVPARSGSRARRLRNSDSLPNAPIRLQAGAVTLEFEPELAFARYIRVGGTEVLRGVYAAVRDQGWLTVLPKVTNLAVEQRDNGFRLTFDATCAEGPVDFQWKGVLSASTSGTIRFEMDGVARSRFLRNRIGFCVLHPLKECAGQPYRAVKADGTQERGVFPADISPHQPVKNLAAITHTVQPGLEAEVRFEGDVFEMEDHRNWTDGNFKTYCTPLDRPYPVEVAAGTRIRQAITIQLRGAPPPAVSTSSGIVDLQPAPVPPVRLPSIGVGSREERAGLLGFRPAHFRVDLRPGADLNRLLAPAAAPLEIAIHAASENELKLAADAARSLKTAVARWLVLPAEEKSTSRRWLDAARRILPPGAPIGGGTNAYFTELNRERPDPSWLDVACYSINPQVHAFDDRSLVENLEPQGDTVRSARRFLGARPIAVTPVTLAPRFNASLREYKPNPPDSRQPSLFAAAWAAASVKYLAEAGAASVTMFEATGGGGLMDVRASPAAYPVWHVLARLAQLAPNAIVRPLTSSDPLRVAALWVTAGRGHLVLVANLTLEPQMVSLPAPGPQVTLARMDERNPVPVPESLTVRSGTVQLGLAPYATHFISTD